MTIPNLQKPVKRSTAKTRKRKTKAENIGRVYEAVVDRDFAECRIAAALGKFGFKALPYYTELAHLRARGMGGNPDLSRDTTANTIIANRRLHTGTRSLHSGHLKVRALTKKGADGPCVFEFYEALPTELKEK